MPQLTDWLPTTRKEMDLRGWDTADIIIFYGDAYVDHPAFGAAVIGRLLEAEGYRVETVEARSRKGVNGDSLRVIRVLKLDEKTVQITYSEFLTNVNRA